MVLVVRSDNTVELRINMAKAAWIHRQILKDWLNSPKADVQATGLVTWTHEPSAEVTIGYCGARYTLDSSSEHALRAVL
jgi:hypothetical protein